MQTECPQCQTIFRVTTEQLQIAYGQVRCSQCQAVFDATETLNIEATEVTETEPATSEDITTSVSATNLELDTPELDTPELDTPELDTPELDMPGELEMPEIEVPDLGFNRPADNNAHNESTETTAEVSVESDQDDITELVAAPDTTTPLATTHVGFDKLRAANEPANQDAADETITGHTEAGDIAAHQEDSGEDTAELAEDDIPTLVEVEGYDPTQLYPELSTSPVEVSRQTGTAWLVLAFIGLLGVFIVQSIVAFRDNLAAHAELRPLMIEFCAALDCPLILPRDPGQIVIVRREVRSHPNQPAALLIKATIKNRASFQQPFPLLRLQFRGLDSEAIASRDFLPEEYLPDDVSINKGMPPDAAINLSLELLDPGKQAVSYTFDFL